MVNCYIIMKSSDLNGDYWTVPDFHSLPILLNPLSPNMYTLSALPFLMIKEGPSISPRAEGAGIGTEISKGHEAKGN